jgi:hypothetical protein
MRRAAAVGLVVLAACKPELGPPDSLVTSVRVLAVRASPPEVKPGDPAGYTALVVSPDGTIAEAPIDWGFCRVPKTLTENNIVSTECLGDAAIAPVGGPAPAIGALVPKDACALFGPDTPPGGYRPRDPDITGGYFQPVRARLGGLTAFALERVTCNLPNAAVDVAREFTQRYVANRNPTLAPLTATLAGEAARLDAIPAGRRVTFHVAWAPEDAETYVRFEPATQSLEDRREALRVSWFATDGAFDSDRTGSAEDDPATTTDNGWTAPAAAGAVHVWVVLRDSRGGVDFAAYDVIVIP